jgi:ATP-dependent Clp protease ATP-binding subunit ClpA
MISQEIKEKIVVLENEISKKVIGQNNLVRDLMIGLFS